MRYLGPIFLSACLAAPLVAPGVALASSSDWLDTDGGRVRLVTTGSPDKAGMLSGVLQIDLLPGWKTYWRDPGEAGVPPSIDVAATPNVAKVDVAFPPPERFDDGYSKWVGYKHAVSLPIKFALKDPADMSAIDANIFLGVCEEICIPVQGRLEVDPASDPDNASDAALVQSAIEALPQPEQPDFGATVISADDDQYVIEANVRGDDQSAVLFVAGEQGYMFGTPKRQDKDGKIYFALPILERPSTAPSDGGLHYTLATSAGAVSGVLAYP